MVLRSSPARLRKGGRDAISWWQGLCRAKSIADGRCLVASYEPSSVCLKIEVATSCSRRRVLCRARDGAGGCCLAAVLAVDVVLIALRCALRVRCFGDV
jgi:hypothetical protein